jgi:hypothetical protein
MEMNDYYWATMVISVPTCQWRRSLDRAVDCERSLTNAALLSKASLNKQKLCFRIIYILLTDGFDRKETLQHNTVEKEFPVCSGIAPASPNSIILIQLNCPYYYNDRSIE